MSELRRPFGLHLSYLDNMVIYMDIATIQMKSLAGAIRDAIARSSKSQRDVAEQAGIPLATLSRRLTRSGRGLRVEEVMALCDVLDLPFANFVSRATAACPKQKKPSLRQQRRPDPKKGINPCPTLPHPSTRSASPESPAPHNR